MVDYPTPPWHTHGRAFLQPYLVRASEVSVPAPLEVESHLGYTPAVLGYVSYETPSPLSYRELVWMPCRVRVRGDDGRIVRGFWVEKMYVDLDASLRAGREIWGLPKQLAKFDERKDRVAITTEDGAYLELALSSRGALPVSIASRVSTVQVRGAEVLRFLGETTRATTGLGGLSVRKRQNVEGFRGLVTAKRLPWLGASLLPFETTMHPPRIVRAS